MIAPLFTQLHDEVEIAPDGRRAVVGGVELLAASPRDLAISVAMALYDEVHARREGPTDALEGFAHIRDTDFERRLAESVRDIRTSYDVTVEGAGVVLIEGVRVRLDDPQLARVSPRLGRHTLDTIGARPALTPGFFLVRSSPWNDAFSRPVLRLYTRVEDAGRAPAVWETATSTLRQLRTPWQAKILSHPASYPRADALVVYLPRSSWRAAAELAPRLSAVAAATGPISRYAEQLAPGVTLAFEPDDSRTGYEGLSFGQHRSRAVAEALVSTAGADRRTSLAAVEKSLIDAGVDPRHPSRNLSTPAFSPLGVFG
ncbi:T3SS effector HopA1 family protein [Microbacterium sp. BH-3-3-3]|uniref:T3SS effector HopA1 family protein n=1 Tax=Microbacterium sp. BH-3-3-3 TaxID=1906742 RepID=UPI0008927C9D|nr:T3SS effector HopA1 family protein [Microbacterium sp. BH-3-3-3]AOX46105.1 hypothetical protein BJP65_10040 [Microbacterium sp. BH-3-3-3]